MKTPIQKNNKSTCISFQKKAYVGVFWKISSNCWAPKNWSTRILLQLRQLNLQNRSFLQLCLSFNWVYTSEGWLVYSPKCLHQMTSPARSLKLEPYQGFIVTIKLSTEVGERFGKQTCHLTALVWNLNGWRIWKFSLEMMMLYVYRVPCCSHLWQRKDIHIPFIRISFKLNDLRFKWGLPPFWWSKLGIPTKKKLMEPIETIGKFSTAWNYQTHNQICLTFKKISKQSSNFLKQSHVMCGGCRFMPELL